MRKYFPMLQLLVTLLLVISLEACNSIQQMLQGTPTPTSTNTLPPTYTPTSTLTPTPTLTSTPTPNATATEFANRSDLMHQDVQKYTDLGYLSASTGTYNELPDFENNFAQINWYQWWSTDFFGNNFVFSAHFRWDIADDSIYVSGCGVSVGPNDAGYIPQVYILHRSKVLVLQGGGYEVNPRKGSGHVDIPSPLEADFTLIVNGSENISYVLVNNKFVGKYKLNYSGSNNLGFVIFSGTSKDYGTHCKISNVRIWKNN